MLEDLPAEIPDILHASRIWIKEHGDLPPTFYSWTKDPNDSFVFATPWADDEQKDRMLDFTKACFKIRGVKAYAVVSEVWVAKGEPGEQPNAALPARLRPDRKEALSLLYVSHTQQAMLSQEIIRCHDGAVMFADMVRMNDDFQGRLIELLPALDQEAAPKDRQNDMIKIAARYYKLDQVQGDDDA